MRKIIPFNDNWTFTKDNVNWEPVTLPHTWNAVDGMDGRGAYHRGQCLYMNQLATPVLQEGERVCLEILALGLCGSVSVNGKEAGSHEGGYSSFVVDITDLLHPRADEDGIPLEAPSNTITILADNANHSHIYPQMADFTFYGGLYRGVNLLILPETHFDVSFHGAPGLAITPEILPGGASVSDGYSGCGAPSGRPADSSDGSAVSSGRSDASSGGCGSSSSRSDASSGGCSSSSGSDASFGGRPGGTHKKGAYPACCHTEPYAPMAVLHLNSWISGASPDYTVRYLITDHAGHTAAETWRPSESPKADILLPHPHLWQGVDDPYLYTCTATLVRRNETVDQVSSRFGIRSFHVDPEHGFFLNGRPMMLRGVSRHQDRLYKGNALTREEHYEDAALIREIGANSVRLAHYQHSRDFYDACDEYGFIVWAEIPYISNQSDDPAAHDNCRLQMEDLIYQNYNHSSICFWGISNEITIAGEKPGLVENHRDLNALVKKLDPSRLTTIAHVSMLGPDSALHGITDVESYNHYFGWYGGSYENNEKWLDHFHETHPEICLGLSEYGAEGIITYQPDTPRCRDYSEAYQAEYHEHMAKILMERPYLWSTYVWNMFDFGCAARNEGGTAGRNNKGLMTIDRKIKKEAFYLYKAYWSREPFVYLCGRRYAVRTGETTTVKVYSNLPRVTLYVNGQPFATKHGDKIFIFEKVPLSSGFTFLTAEAEGAPGCVCLPPGTPACTAPPTGRTCTSSGAACTCAAPAACTAFAASAVCAPYSSALTCAYVTDTMTLEKADKKPEIYTLPQEDEEGDGVANWFETVETVASDAPMEYSETHFSVHDKINTISANEEAFRILANAMYSMTGMKMKKSMLAMLGEKTLMELSGMMSGMGGTEKKIPENAMQIINSELNKVRK